MFGKKKAQQPFAQYPQYTYPAQYMASEQKKSKLKTLALTLPAGVVYLLGGLLIFFLPVILLIAAFAIPAMQRKAEGKGYETGITKDGEFRYSVDKPFSFGTDTTQNSVLIDPDGVLKVKERYTKGNYSVSDYTAVNAGTAQLVTEYVCGEDDSYELYRITGDGRKVIDLTCEKITAIDYEELTGNETEGWDYSKTAKYLPEALEKAGQSDRLNPPATEAQIAKWERINDRKLPEELREFLKITNGFEFGNTRIYSLEEMDGNTRPGKCPKKWFTVGKNGSKYIVSNDSYMKTYNTKKSEFDSYTYELDRFVRDHVIKSLNEQSASGEKIAEFRQIVDTIKAADPSCVANEPVTAEGIKNWHSHHVGDMPFGVDELMQVTNGLKFGETEIYPIEDIEYRSKVDSTGGWYVIGTVPGGRQLVVPKSGKLCLYDGDMYTGTTLEEWLTVPGAE